MKSTILLALCAYAVLFVSGKEIGPAGQEVLVREHNKCRDAVGVGLPPVVKGYEGEYLGENIAESMLQSPGQELAPEHQAILWDSNTPEGLALMLHTAVQSWCLEKEWYNPSDNSCVEGKHKTCGHYKQVVWKESVRIGCGISSAVPSHLYIVACLYYAPGNVNNLHPYDRTEPSQIKRYCRNCNL